MKKCISALTALAGFLLCIQIAAAQPFSIENYKNFLRDNKDLTSERLYNLYPVGLYKAAVKPQSSTLYLDSINQKLSLTSDEKKLIGQHGFMVSERLGYESFWAAFEDLWNKDIPIFFTSDAMLHSIHMSYDAILKDIEISLLIPKLSDALSKMHNQLPQFAEKYLSTQTEPPNYDELKKSINDLDLYLTVARKLLEVNGATPKFSENLQEISKVLNLISSLSAAQYNLFSENTRIMDFSQFTVRGHYTQKPELGRYFKSMIWLGRTEFYLIAPKSDDCKQTPEDIRRQIIDAAMIAELAEETGADVVLSNVNKIIEAMVGESDNVQLQHIKELMNDAGLSNTLELLDMKNVEKFQTTLKTKPYAEQKILSQILISNDFTSPEQLEPASAFMLLGQRFVIDSYVTGNVVFDKIYFEGAKICRLLPSSLDVLFALGNNAAADLVQPELDEYHYGTNLASLRYLIDSYSEDFWQNSVYNSWLGSIRTLNPPDDADRAKLPKFMQTAAWWQQKMNTQLASWAQLRHDNLLYAKQSYTGGAGCSYPYAYAEPVPVFYASCAALATTAKTKIGDFLGDDPNPEISWMKQRISKYFDHLYDVSKKLQSIATKELRKEQLTQDEDKWLKSIFNDMGGCVPTPGGWYANLFYNEVEDAQKLDLVVADVHTAPTDCDGNMMGYVWHVGTGKINLAVIVTENENGELTAYAGPVMSFLENVSLNFKRLTDEEWKDMYNTSDAARPAFTKLYLADKDGNSPYANPPMLPVDTQSDVAPEKEDNIRVFTSPNPFSESVVIKFELPSGSSNSVSAWITDINGKRIVDLFSGSVPANNFSLRWDGFANDGTKAAKGMYFYHLNINGVVQTGKLILK